MIIGFANNKIERLCNNPDKFGPKEGLPKKIIQELKLALSIMKNMDSCADFFTKANKGFMLEKLTNKKGLMSIRLNRKYRLTFYEINHEENKTYFEIKGIEIVKVDNHYGD